ncbi:MAG: MBOAT family protein, partial [Anaerotignum sp.]|nr:MBOAT family protein [Anaerotignum sp.]
MFAFLPVTLGGYYFLPVKFRNGFLTLMSLLFYAWGEPKFVFVMIFSILMNYFFGLLVAKREEAAWQRKI